MTQEEAEQIIVYLEAHPFILDYCDCCGSSDVYLMKVIGIEMVECTYIEEKKSVVATVIKLGKLKMNEGILSAYGIEAVDDAEVESLIIMMNYAFIYSACGKWAVPFFKEVDYYRDYVYNGATRFPSPSDNEETLKDIKYKEWFVENIED